MKQTAVILLNADYSFLNTIDWKKAMCLISKGKAEILKHTNRIIRTARGLTIKMPLIMRLIKFIRTLYKTKVPFSKKSVLIRDGMACTYCGNDTSKLTIDHIVPKTRGGKSTFENTVASCKTCNNTKGSKLCTEAKMFPRVKAYQPTISEFLRMKISKLGISSVIDDFFKGL